MTVRQVLAVASGSVAVFCLLGALLAAVALFVASKVTTRRRLRQYPDLTALRYTVELVTSIGPDGRLGKPGTPYLDHEFAGTDQSMPRRGFSTGPGDAIESGRLGCPH